jgi:transcriptional regulator with XRE-family HTH domain
MNIELHESVLDALQACKGKGHWEEIAERAGISPSTLEKIARQSTGNPGVQTVQNIAKVMKAMRLYPAKKVAA